MRRSITSPSMSTFGHRWGGACPITRAPALSLPRSTSAIRGMASMLHLHHPYEAVWSNHPRVIGRRVNPHGSMCHPLWVNKPPHQLTFGPQPTLQPTLGRI
jgi:hypothetical protein